MPGPVDLAQRGLSARFGEHFPLQLDGPRTVGREAEYPLVRPDGSAADARAVLRVLAGRPGAAVKREGELIVSVELGPAEYALEVGWGTIELITGPCPDLHGLRGAHEAGLEALVTAADACGAVVLGLGAQPVTPPTLALMSPKARYGTLLEVLGDAWLWFAVTASDQVHVDVARPELIAMTDLCNALSGAIVALCGNSPLIGGQRVGAASGREARMGEIHAGSHRHGLPAGPAVDLDGWIAHLCRQEHLMARPDGVWRPVGEPFTAWLEKNGADWPAFLDHEHYLWNSARPRAAQSTVELRPACQQPWEGHDAAAALGLGLVEAAPELTTWLAQLLEEPSWSTLRGWHGAVVRQGLAAEEPVDGLLAGVLDRCAAALERRGRGEQSFLQPLRDRLERRENPAQQALSILDEAGMEGLIAARGLRG